MASNAHPVQAYMSALPHSIGFDQSLEKAEELMEDNRIRHLPVLKGGKLLGVLSDRDIRIARSFTDLDLTNVKAEDIMVDAPYTVAPETPVARVAREMAENKYGSAIVLQKEKVVGIFTAIDGLKALADLLEKQGG